jgi:hypothetical protein
LHIDYDYGDIGYEYKAPYPFFEHRSAVTIFKKMTELLLYSVYQHLRQPCHSRFRGNLCATPVDSRLRGNDITNIHEKDGGTWQSLTAIQDVQN